MGFDPISMAVAAVTIGSKVHQANQQKKAQKRSEALQREQADLAAEQNKIVPMPDETSPGVRYRLDATRRSMGRRRGAASTLITGQLGDVRAPPVSAPLVLGRTG